VTAKPAAKATLNNVDLNFKRMDAPPNKFSKLLICYVATLMANSSIKVLDKN
jgi:hypothetical protein